MEEAKVILILGTAVLVPLIICLAILGTLGYVVSRIAAHFALTRRFVQPISALVATSVLLSLVTGLIVAFGAIANAEASSKATMLARGISEALTCTPVVLRLLAVIIGVIGLVLVMWRWSRRSSSNEPT
jgi:hypothetical protein